MPKPSENPEPRRCRYFTIIEMLTVISIIAILMVIGVGAYHVTQTRIAKTRTEAVLQKIKAAMENFKLKYGYYIQQSPKGNFKLDNDNFNTMIDLANMKKNETEQDFVIDGFKRRIIYQCPGAVNKTSFDLYSMGQNGVDNSSSTKGGDDIWAK